MIHPRRVVILGPPLTTATATFTGTRMSPKGIVAPPATTIDPVVASDYA